MSREEEAFRRFNGPIEEVMKANLISPPKKRLQDYAIEVKKTVDATRKQPDRKRKL